MITKMSRGSLSSVFKYNDAFCSNRNKLYFTRERYWFRCLLPSKNNVRHVKQRKGEKGYHLLRVVMITISHPRHKPAIKRETRRNLLSPSRFGFPEIVPARRKTLSRVQGQRCAPVSVHLSRGKKGERTYWQAEAFSNRLAPVPRAHCIHSDSPS